MYLPPDVRVIGTIIDSHLLAQSDENPDWRPGIHGQ